MRSLIDVTKTTLEIGGDEHLMTRVSWKLTIRMILTPAIE